MEPAVASGWPVERTTDRRCARPRPLSAAPLPLLPLAGPGQHEAPRDRLDSRGFE